MTKNKTHLDKVLEDFEEKATWKDFGRLTSEEQKDFCKNFIKQTYTKAQEEFKEKIIKKVEEKYKNRIDNKNQNLWDMNDTDWLKYKDNVNDFYLEVKIILKQYE